MYYLDTCTREVPTERAVVISTEPVFSEGTVFSSSLCTNTLAQSFYNKNVLPIVSALLSTSLTNFKGKCSVGEVQLLQADIPTELQVCMRPLSQLSHSSCPRIAARGARLTHVERYRTSLIKI